MKDLLAKLNINVAQLAEEAGYSKSTVYRVLNGKGSDKATKAIQAYLDELAYWAGEKPEPELADIVNVDNDGMSNDAYIEAWYQANKDSVEPVIEVNCQEDRFFKQNASLIKDAIYNVKSPGGRRTPKAVSYDSYDADVKLARAGAERSEWKVGEYTDTNGNLVEMYDNGGILGKVHRLASAEINYGRAEDQEISGRFSIYEEGFNPNTVRVVDDGGNFIMNCSYNLFRNYFTKENAMIKQLAQPSKRELNRKARKELAISILKQIIGEIHAATSYKVIKEEIIGGAYERITNALKDEFGVSFVADKCNYVDAAELKKKHDITGLTGDEIMQLAIENDCVSNLNKQFWKIAYKAMYGAVDKSAWKQNRSAAKSSQDDTNAEIYKKVQNLLTRIPSEDAKHLGSLIADGTAYRNFGLTQQDAKKATWYAYQNRSNKAVRGFSKQVYYALLDFGKADLSKFKSVAYKK